MVIKKDKRKFCKPRSKSIKQKVWDYMRRNRTFRFGDVIAITGVTPKYLKMFLLQLRHAKYVKIVEKVKPLSSTYYTLVKCTGVKSPTVSNDVLYDYNTNEEIEIKPTPSILKILNCMNETKMTTEQVCRLSDIGISTVKKWFAKFLILGVTLRINPIEKIDNERVLFINLEKVEQLKLDIKNKDFEIKGAWKNESNTVEKSL